MLAVLAFLGALAASVVVAVVVNWVRDGRAHDLDAWTPGPGERRLLEDPAADFHAARLGQARRMSFARLHRMHAVLTDTRLVIAIRALLAKRYMITHMVHRGGETPRPGSSTG